MNSFEPIEKSSINSIIILRALQLGDMLCSVPAFRALRGAFPAARITLVGLPWEKEFVQRYGNYFTDFLEFPGYPGLPEQEPQMEKVPGFLAHIQSRQYDLALQMQGSGFITNSLVMLFGAAKTAGFHEPDRSAPAEGHFIPYPANESEVWRHLRLMESLGIPLKGDALEFPLTMKDWDDFYKIQRRYGLRKGGYAVIHAGARRTARRWPVERFAQVGEELAERGLTVVLTGSPAESRMAAELSARMMKPAVNLVGGTTLGSLGALLAASRLLVCNDTGVSHLADALHIPSVVLFTAPDMDRWAPRNQNLHRVLTHAPEVKPSLVMKEVDRLLEVERAYAVP